MTEAGRKGDFTFANCDTCKRQVKDKNPRGECISVSQGEVQYVS